MNRRQALQSLTAAASPLAAAQSAARRGLPPVKITDIDERVAAKFPYKTPGGSRGNDRRLDGTIVRP